MAMTMTCPNGHETTATDYCDTCGAAMPADAGAADAGASADSPDAGTPAPKPGDTVAVPILDPDAASSAASGDSQACPSCGVANAKDALFCEACGYDFTTGTMPRTETSTPQAETPSADTGPDTAANSAGGSIAPPLEGDAWVAELWIDPQWYAEQSSPDSLPSAGPPVVVPLENTSLLVGRASKSRDIHPDVDCGADNGVSRRHAQLTTDGTRWWVEDLGSSNGTFVAGAVDPLPTAPIEVGVKREVGPDDRIYVGSWTRLVIRKADPGEVV
jgi:hypothetical protein